ncbi:MAG: SdiA-regulated domain-containing protein, partial [Gloeobacteraceae cyanobacterium ES-bin-144]|nr:SdiA-regulated domain-containing protein [Verrucomicrobiales bacterium]
MKFLSISSVALRSSSFTSRAFLFASGVFSIAGVATAVPPTAVDLHTYVRTARYNLPEPTRTTAPANSALCEEASAVTYNWDTNTLFVIGDEGTSVVQVSKTGA